MNGNISLFDSVNVTVTAHALTVKTAPPKVVVALTAGLPVSREVVLLATPNAPVNNITKPGNCTLGTVRTLADGSKELPYTCWLTAAGLTTYTFAFAGACFACGVRWMLVARNCRMFSGPLPLQPAFAPNITRLTLTALINTNLNRLPHCPRHR